MATITFDFDDTLTQTQWDASTDCFRFTGPNLVMIQCLRTHLDLGDDVHIITSRMGPDHLDDPAAAFTGQPSVSTFLTDHLGDDRHRLTGVHFTAGDLKWRLLHELDSDRHFDDDPCELEALPPGCMGVRVPTLHGLE